ncbi:MAG: arsenate reductase ArsC, partial [Oscillospiraceae bacterium]|nr:arsenate reductase ArsC [Oscillospiraceae bacterium]
LMKQLYGIDMELTQYSKTFDKIPSPDIVISMGCDVGCPYIGRDFGYNWGLTDPTGKSDAEFEKIIRQIEKNIIELKMELSE